MGYFMSIETKDHNKEPVSEEGKLDKLNIIIAKQEWTAKIPFDELSSIIKTYNKFAENKLSFEAIYYQNLLTHQTQSNITIDFKLMKKVIKLHCNILFLHCKNLSERFDKIGWDICIDRETNEHLSKIYGFQSKNNIETRYVIKNKIEFLYQLHEIENHFKSIWDPLKEMSMLLDIKTIQGVTEIPWK